MFMSGCIFCAIAAGEQPAKILYEDDDVVAFADIAPQAPVHVLVIPRRHFATLEDLTEADSALAGRLVVTARRLARELGIAAAGYRLVINVGAEGGQAVQHLHLHLLGGRRLAPALG